MNPEISELLERIAGNLEGIAAALDESHPSLSMWTREMAHSIDSAKHLVKKRRIIRRLSKASEDKVRKESEKDDER